MDILDGGLRSNLYKSIIDKAVEAALKSNHTQKHGAVIFKGKRIYSIGFNHPNRSVRSVNPIAQKWKTSVHAEIASILNAKRNIANFDILVVRLNNKNQLMMSRPCTNCLVYLDYCGIRNIYYSIDHYPYIVKFGEEDYNV